jgi:hypothetical protein
MAPISNFYSGTSGLNNKVSPHRLPLMENGVATLVDSNNVLVDQSGEAISRRGTSLLEAGSFHSFCKTSGGFYVVKERANDAALYKASVNLSDGSISTLSGIRDGLTKGKRVCYSEPLDDKVYYGNGVEHGFLQNDTSFLWPINEWSVTDRNETMVATPIGSHIGILSGRIILAVNDEIVFTEYGLPGLVDNARGRVRFESNIRMISCVQSGVYVSDASSVYFLMGNNPQEWKMTKVLDYPAKEFGAHQDLIDPSLLGIDSIQLSCLFATEKGPVIGFPDGNVLNLISKKMELPADCGTVGSVMLVDQITILQSGV